MPHVIIECSANLRRRVDLKQLVATVHDAALETGVFPLGGTRTRVSERADYKIADGHPDNAFVHVILRIGHGRDLATKRAAATRIFDRLCDFLGPVIETAPIGISLEVQEIDPELSFKKNNLHDHVERRKKAAL